MPLPLAHLHWLIRMWQNQIVTRSDLTLLLGRIGVWRTSSVLPQKNDEELIHSSANVGNGEQFPNGKSMWRFLENELKTLSRQPRSCIDLVTFRTRWRSISQPPKPSSMSQTATCHWDRQLQIGAQSALKNKITDKKKCELSQSWKLLC